jgi:hypothetical protein
MSIDDEWASFLMDTCNTSRVGYESTKSTRDTQRLELYDSDDILGKTGIPSSAAYDEMDKMPKCEELYISTKTKVLFLNQEIDIHSIFWDIPITEYWRPNSGVVKKQMKIVSNTVEEFDQYSQKLVNIPYYTEHIIKQINNPNARRNKFKDERKITVGISKKDIMNCRGKVKNAFYNCFAMILRFIHGHKFHEIHVKIFNTGKMEIPGILNAELLTTVKRMILEVLSPLNPEDKEDLAFVENEKEDSVLINSNFNCGFYINREKLYSILRSPIYNIETAYDPCSYPGVKCKFYFNHDYGFDIEKQRGCICEEDHLQKMSELGDNKKYTEVSFMIFRTGSCLIVGNCSEEILRFIFVFIKTILHTEYRQIYTHSEDTVVRVKKQKLRKKLVSMTSQYYNQATAVCIAT